MATSRHLPPAHSHDLPPAETAPVQPAELQTVVAEPADPTELLPGRYYQVIHDDGDRLPAGELVLVTEVDTVDVHFACRDQQYTAPLAHFRQHYRFAPDGDARRHAEITDVLQGLAAIQRDQAALTTTLVEATPHLLPAVERGTGGGTTMIFAGDVSTPEAAKRQLATMRNTVAKTQNTVLAQQAKLQALLAERQTALVAQAEQMKKVMQRMDEAIWAVNLYLGRDETIVQLQAGEPAPADARIHVRQLVLYADEECAIAAEGGGIDVHSFDQFESWLADANHLQQVLPEPKGVVAIKIRRTEKDYGEPWLNMQLNAANRQTLFLMRNGANVYRIQTDLAVGRTLLPLANEFEELFWEQGWGFGRRARETRTPLEPGSRAYMKAMEAADAKTRHYLRIFLFLQGLLDRTRIFQPLPAPRMNILDVRTQEELVTLVMDAEADRMLPTGRLPYHDWVKAVNAKLDIGCRVMGVFQDYYHGLRQDERRSRVHPASASLPDNATLYTIDRAEGDALVFLYDRGEDYVYRRRRGDASGAPKTRASCRIRRDDDFVLNVDAVTEEECAFYLTSRVNRHAYSYIFPVLKAAIRIKRAEAAAEAPFRQLLVGEIMKAHKADPTDAERLVPELVTWWKFKNRIHRALTSDDAKAVRMIVAEYARRVTRATERRALAHERVVAAVRAAAPAVLYVGHVRDREYVALIPHADSTVFVTEARWRLARDGTPTRVSAAPWRTVDRRRLRWASCYESAAWASWRVDARPRKHLTGPELVEIAAAARALAPEVLAWVPMFSSDRDEARRTAHQCTVPLVLTYTGDQQVLLYIWSRRAELRDTRLLTDQPAGPKVQRCRVHWRRVRERVVIERLGQPQEIGWRPWRSAFDQDEPESTYDPFGDGTAPVTRVWEDTEAIARTEADFVAFEMQEARRGELEEVVDAIWHQANAANAALVEAREYARFLAEYGDPELWEPHKKNLARTLTVPYADRVRRATARLVERGAQLDGLTIGELLVFAEALGDRPSAGDRDKDVIAADTVLVVRSITDDASNMRASI